MAQTSRTQTGGERENLEREKQNGSAATRARNQTEAWRNPSASLKRATLPRDRKEKRERKILRRGNGSTRGKFGGDSRTKPAATETDSAKSKPGRQKQIKIRHRDWSSRKRGKN
jgi:hypothetical protein